MNKNKRVAIICPVYNNIDDLPDLFNSLSDLDYDKNLLDLIMVDNGSKDNSVSFIKEMFELLKNNRWRNLVLIENKENLGIPMAYNIGYKKVENDIFAILRIETDILMDKNLMNNLIYSMLQKEIYKEIGIIGCLIKDTNYKNVCGAINFNKWINKISTFFPKHFVKCDGVLGCCMLINLKAIKNLDYFFDSSLFISGDETDLSFRLKKIGYKTYFEPLAIVIHKSGHSTMKIPELTRYYNIRNNIILLKKHANIFKFINSLLYSFTWVLWKRVQGENIPIKAFWDGLFFRN